MPFALPSPHEKKRTRGNLARSYFFAAGCDCHLLRHKPPCHFTAFENMDHPNKSDRFGALFRGPLFSSV